MYRINRCNCGSSRERLEPQLLNRIAAENHNANHTENCKCGCERVMPLNEVENNDSCLRNNGYAAEFDYSLAMVYSPYQQFQNLYCEEEGFMAGTIFKELDKQFYGPKCGGGKCNE